MPSSTSWYKCFDKLQWGPQPHTPILVGILSVFAERPLVAGHAEPAVRP